MKNNIEMSKPNRTKASQSEGLSLPVSLARTTPTLEDDKGSDSGEEFEASFDTSFLQPTAFPNGLLPSAKIASFPPLEFSEQIPYTVEGEEFDSQSTIDGFVWACENEDIE